MASQNRFREPNIDRLIAAMRREKLDRVPNWESVFDPAMTAHIMGCDVGPRNIDLSPQNMIELARRTYQDAICVFAGPVFAVEGGFCGWDDVERWAAPDPAEFRKLLQPYCDAVANTNMGMCVALFGPFFTTYMAMGPLPIQSFLLNLYEDLPLVERLMDVQIESQMSILEAIIDLPFSFFEIADDTCDHNGYMCRTDIMDQVWAPRMAKLVGLAKRKDVPIMWHCCGKLDQVLPHLVEWGVEAVEPVQPASNDIYALKKEWGDRIAFRGNINIEGVLAFGTPDEVRADTREHIDRLAGDGGYVVSSSHSIVDAIPPENYRAMVDTACDYGRY